MKPPDDHEILSDSDSFNSSKDDTDNTDNTVQKRVVTNKLFPKAASKAARSAEEGKAEEDSEVAFDDTSFDIDQFAVNDQNAAEAVEDNANNGAAHALPSNKPGDRRTPTTSTLPPLPPLTWPADAANHSSDESNRDSTAPLWPQDDTHASYQVSQSHDAETGIQVASSIFMADVVATRVGDDLVIQATPMGPSKWSVLTNAIKKHRLCFMAALLLIVAAVVTPVVVLTRPKDMSQQIATRIKSITNAVIAVSGNSALDTTTHQSNALTWLLEGGALDLSPDDPRLIQRYVLALMYYSLGGDDWSDKFFFLSDANECVWSEYFVCNNSTIEGIELSSNNLNGSLPSEIGTLKSLRTLNLSGNQLYDSIPQHLTMLSVLQRLELWNNSLTGPIPESIAGMSALQELGLSFNQLTGTMPTSLGNLVNLEHFYADDNLLEGSIPSEFGSLTNLEIFSVYQNKLTGVIPTEIGQLTKLLTLWVYINLLHGSIPSEIGRLTALVTLSIHENNLTGTIPTEIGLLTNMIAFSVYDNELTGSVPSSVCNLNQTDFFILVDCEVNCSCCAKCY